MKETTLPLLKRLNVPMLNAGDIAELKRLQKEWERWEQREFQIMPLRIAEEQKAAFTAFLDNPTPENEQRLADLADTTLTTTRYAMLRRAFKALRGKITAQAASILKPVLDRASAALQSEYENRMGKCEPVMGSIKNHPDVREVRRTLDAIVSHAARVFTALDAKSDLSPMVLADSLLA